MLLYLKFNLIGIVKNQDNQPIKEKKKERKNQVNYFVVILSLGIVW